MNHFVVTSINTDVGSSRCIICVLEKHKVAFYISRGYTGADVSETIRTEPSDVPAHTAVIDYQDTKPEQSKEVLGEEPPQT